MKNATRAHYRTDYEVGQDNVRMMGMDLHNPVFFLSAVFIVVFVSGSVLAPERANTLLESSKQWVLVNFDWLFMAGPSLLLLFCLWLIVGRFGSVRLGGPSAKPEFSLLSWFAMLFAAGMGIGLLYWGVAEPMAYYTGWFETPFNVAPFSQSAADLALPATIYHWGFQAWAIYATVGLCLAFFAYNKGLPLTIRSVFYPLLRERIWGWPGHFIDILAVLATIFGLATSLGFGASQANSGFNFMFGLEQSLVSKLFIVAGVTLCALVSVVRGINGGVKLLSNLNMGLAALLLLLVLFIGPTGEIVKSFFNTGVGYLANLPQLSNWIGREDEAWMHGWSVFYWAWWVSWSPFVGMFIARISKGRTIREFLLAVLVVPTLVTMLWMVVFGASALAQAQAGVGELANGISDTSLATFHMLSNLPFASFTTIIGTFLVIVFFITSSDSGSLVIDSITAGGKVDAPVPQRVFWAIMQGLIAAVLLALGGDAALGALQSGTIITGLPFMVVLLLMMVCLVKGLMRERRYLDGPS
jgi:BCCT family betaine/carnitine transporter